MPKGYLTQAYDWLSGVDWGGGWDWLNAPAGNRVDPKNAQLQDRGQMTDLISQGLQGIQGRQAPDLAGVNINTRDSDEWRRKAIDLANQYGAVATGEQAGAGELAVNRARDAALANQMAMQRMNRGAGAAMAGRTAARTSADIGAQSANLAAEKALADQMAARQALGNLTGAMRGQDIEIAMRQAGLDQARNFTELKAKLDMMHMNDQQYNAMLEALFGINRAEMEARIRQEQTAAGLPTNMEQIGQGIGGLGGLLGGIGVM